MNNNEKVKVCSQCKTTFSCFSENCWCSELPLVMPMIEGEDCLCPKCLKAVIDKKLKMNS